MKFQTLLLLSASTALAQNQRVLPGIPWYDTAGNPLQAHGAGMYEQDGTYYLIGENKTKREGNPGGHFFNSVACYSSRDLLAWDFVNDLLTPNASSPDLGANRVIERPKILFNDQTNQYVMWMHVDSADYNDARSGVAVGGGSLCGDYEYLGSERPLGNIARDMTLFKDDDGTGYLVAEDRDEGTHFFRLADDYLSVEQDVGVISKGHMPGLEAPAVVKVDGVYYFFGSQLSGWSPNENQYTTATNLSGPWAEPAYFAPEGTKTCTSQATFILPAGDGKFMYMGDRWFEHRLDESQYIWLPLTIDSGNRTASVECRDAWLPSEIGV